MQRPWTKWTSVDEQLAKRTGLDRFTLARIRRQMYTEYQGYSYVGKTNLTTMGTSGRLGWLTSFLTHSLGEEAWQRWLHYLEHSQQDLDEMALGRYPISPYLIRVYSALFGIQVDFLLLGTAPQPDGLVNIDLWPGAMTK